MDKIDLTNPLLIAVIAAIFIGLLALTLRSIVMRERAIIRSRPDSPSDKSDYENRWRIADAA